MEKPSSGPHQQQEPQSAASFERKLAKAWKNPLPARSSKSRKAADSVRFQAARELGARRQLTPA